MILPTCKSGLYSNWNKMPSAKWMKAKWKVLQIISAWDLARKVLNLDKAVLNPDIFNICILPRQQIWNMEIRHLRFKKYITALHIISGILTLLSVAFFIKNEKYYWLPISFLAFYIISDVIILLVFFKTLAPVQKWYFEIVFTIPFLLIAFIIFIKLFEYFLFS